MKNVIVMVLSLGIALGSAGAVVAASENAAEGKAVGQTDKGERGASASAPGQTGDTGKEAAPGQTK